MAFVKYTDLETPDDVLTKIAEYVTSRGYTVIETLKDDTNVYDRSSVDGKKFVFMDRTQTYYINLRSFNEVWPFGTNDDAYMDIQTPDIDYRYQGIAMTVSEGYSRTQRWYNQYLVPTKYRDKDVQCVCIPIPRRTAQNTDGTTNINANANKYTLYCNNIVEPTDTLVFSVVAENIGGDTYRGHDYRAVHLACGMLRKYDDWEGGYWFTGSTTPALLKSAYDLYATTTTKQDDGVTRITDEEAFYEIKDSGILPILSSGTQSNTFLRIDIDDAPKETRGFIRWASSGTDNITGKKLSMPVRVDHGGNGVIPHYAYMQSQSRLDWGRNINTLNCITLNMPNYMAVLVDPDVLENYAACGQVTGVYYVSMLNMQTSYTYEMSYPRSQDLCQVHSYSMRRGRYGFDGISIRQLEDDSDSTEGDITP